jgi:hypothetical protein
MTPIAEGAEEAITVIFEYDQRIPVQYGKYCGKQCF